MGTGTTVRSGIIWDSNTEDEYKECLMKADFLNHQPRSFQLFESLLWDPKVGYFLLEEHLKRLSDSASYFDFIYNDHQTRERLLESESNMPPEGAKVRLTLDPDGTIDIEIGSLGGVKNNNLNVGLALSPIDSQNQFLYHKTTIRDVYEQAKLSRPDCDDVILWNERNEVTESCRSNVVVEIGGELLTPPIHCGLLSGTFRDRLLSEKKIKERVITTNDLKNAYKIYTINSVRRWMTTHFVERV